ncbi:MAG: zinc-binding dehydrogenase, partial [Acidimicrobiia bacterium]|nr:zinc-binding dehydrogenase [Acidimicrobiia bacterium]
VIDYTAEDFAGGSERYDLIIDTGGRNSIRRLRSVLAPTGTLVIVGGEGGGRWTGGIGRQLRAMVRSLFTRQRLTSMISKEDRAFIEPLADHMGRGEVIPAIGRRFDLAEVPDALRLLAAGSLSGKTVIVDDEAGADAS